MSQEIYATQESDVQHINETQNLDDQKPNEILDSNVQLKYETQITDDQRLKPKARKHAKLWQLYLLHQEMTEFRKKHILRRSSADRGKSNLNSEFEQWIINHFNLDQHVEPKNKAQREGGLEKRTGIVYDTPSIFHLMVEAGKEVGPIWDWLVSHDGIGESLAAKTLALIDDIQRFDTVSKLWRYAGYGLNHYWCDKTGKAICPREGWKWIDTNKGKYRVWTIVDSQCTDETHIHNAQNDNGQHNDDIQHVRANNNGHIENETQRSLAPNKTNGQHPDETQVCYALPLEKQWAFPQNNDLPPLQRVDYLEPEPDWELRLLSDRLCKSYHAPYCTPLKSTLYLICNDQFNRQSTAPYKDMYEAEKQRLMEKGKKRGHAHNMAWRKVKKEFLKELWLNWRQFEGLSISEPYETKVQMKPKVKVY